MYCIKAEIPQHLWAMDDELKVIYHSNDSGCIWVLATCEARNRFVEETAGMVKSQRQQHYADFFCNAD
jgi:hypothetical protein